MAERLNAADSKSAEGANPPWVRIPPFPPENITALIQGGSFLFRLCQLLYKNHRIMPTYRNYPQQTAIGRRFLSMFYGINLYGYFLKWELAIMVETVTPFNPVRVRDAGKAGFIKPVRFDVRMPSEP